MIHPAPNSDVAGAIERLDKVLAGTSAWKTYAHHLGKSFPEDLRLILSAYDRQGEEIERLRGILDGIKWRSDDKDNMEFAARITYVQMDEILAARARQGGPDHG